MPTDQCLCRIIHQDRVERASQAMPPNRETDRLSLLFKALADQSRIKMLMALEQGEMCVCDLAAFLGVSESAVSHQLRMLRQLTLVANRREGPVLYYRLADAHVSQLVRLALEHIRE
ncbi:MAG: metalloregulator ArsR/SmtB family transcription factor [Desulfobulbaceae bacterium]|nr:metalloregulator ArsR/SmtB family transcription factor [Desulfobulbaceae bacterium]HIJ90473.1 winged helix-turn-helix transcriptional regulator [Deltaproteobacteria bacterium]